MTLEELIAATGERFFTEVLAEACPSIVHAAEAAYFERIRMEENKLYEAKAMLLVDGRLHLFNLISEGHRFDDQQDTIQGTTLPLRAIVRVESRLIRTGWARGDDTRSMNDREYEATIVLDREAGSLGVEIHLPFGDDRRLGERYAPFARAFVEHLTEKVGHV